MPRAKKTWYRLHVELLRDRKIRRLPAAQRWVWIALLSIARQSPTPGTLLLDDGSVAVVADIVDEAAVSDKDVRTAIESFMASGMVHLDGSAIVITQWHERQFESDNVTARTQAHRDRIRNSQFGEGDDEGNGSEEHSSLERSYGCSNGSSYDGSYERSDEQPPEQPMGQDRNVLGNDVGTVYPSRDQSPRVTEKTEDKNKNPQTPKGVASPPFDATQVGNGTVGRSKIPPPKHEPEAFRRFYQLYPRHDNPGDAAKAWQSGAPSPDDITAIFAALKPFENCKLTADETTKVKAPGPWLRARRWESEAPFPGLQIHAEEKRRQEIAAMKAVEVDFQVKPPPGTEFDWGATLANALAPVDLTSDPTTLNYTPPRRHVGASIADIARRHAQQNGQTNAN